MHVSAVASGRLPHNGMIISTNLILADDDECPIVSHRPQAASGSGWVFTGLFSLPIETLQREFLQWDPDMQTQCCLRDTSMLDSEFDIVSSVLTRIWRQQCSPDETPSRFVLNSSEIEMVEELSTNGLVEYDGD